MADIDMCGWLNQKGKPCTRVGRCPFHDKLKYKPEVEMPASPSVSDAVQLENGSAAYIMRESTAKRRTNSSEVSSVTENQNSGQGRAKAAPWTKQEHVRFLQGLQMHGKGYWRDIALIVGTRTAAQIQSHAQKYYQRQSQPDDSKHSRSMHDCTLEELQSELDADSEFDPTSTTTRHSTVSMLIKANYVEPRICLDNRHILEEDITKIDFKAYIPPAPTLSLSDVQELLNGHRA